MQTLGDFFFHQDRVLKNKCNIKNGIFGILRIYKRKGNGHPIIFWP